MDGNDRLPVAMLHARCCRKTTKSKKATAGSLTVTFPAPWLNFPIFGELEEIGGVKLMRDVFDVELNLMCDVFDVKPWQENVFDVQLI